MLLTAMSLFKEGLMERLLNAVGDNHTDPGSGHVKNLENDCFCSQGLNHRMLHH